MAFFSYLHAVLTAQLAELREKDADRGDSPVPTAVIIAGLVLAAAAVTALVSTKATDWMNSIAKP